MPLPAPAELLDRLQQIHAEHANAIAREDLDLVCAHVDDFHHTFFAAVGNRYLAQMIEQLWTETLGVRSYAIGDPLLRARSYEEHGLILDALAAGDRARLEWLVVDHIWSAFNAYKRANGALAPLTGGANHRLAACRTGVFGGLAAGDLGEPPRPLRLGRLRFAVERSDWGRFGSLLCGRRDAWRPVRRGRGRTSASGSTPWSRGSTRRALCRDRAMKTGGIQAPT